MRDKLHTLNNLLVPLVGYRELIDQRLYDLLSASPGEQQDIAQDIQRLICDMCDAADRASLVVQELQRSWRAREPAAAMSVSR